MKTKKYYVCKPMFLVNGENKGEYDILVYDNQENVYWAVEVKHSSEIGEEQSKHLRNPFFKEIIDRQYGTRADFFVLYRGESQISNGVKYINIADFMFELYESKDINETLLQIGEEFALEQELSSEDDNSIMLAKQARMEMLKNGCVTVICPMCKKHPCITMTSKGERTIISCPCGYVKNVEINF